MLRPTGFDESSSTAAEQHVATITTGRKEKRKTFRGADPVTDDMADSNNNNNDDDFACREWNALAADGGGGVVDFYDGASVFVTGGTGFVGKALIEKLLRSCPGLGTVFLLIRPKRGKDIQCRYQELLENPVSNDKRENVARLTCV